MIACMTEPSAAKQLRRPRVARPSSAVPVAQETIDTRYLETLVGYNARRAALAVIGVFLPEMAPFGLRPVDFSVLSLIAHNPGITSRQLCATLDILPPNLVGMIKSLEQRELIEKRDHPSDRRAQGLHLTSAGQALQTEAETKATQLELDVTHRLTAAERQTLIRLLRKIYLKP
jgi:DNA-binding MarR family transcriptional regulator